MQILVSISTSNIMATDFHHYPTLPVKLLISIHSDCIILCRNVCHWARSFDIVIVTFAASTGRPNDTDVGGAIDKNRN